MFGIWYRQVAVSQLVENVIRSLTLIIARSQLKYLLLLLMPLNCQKFERNQKLELWDVNKIVNKTKFMTLFSFIYCLTIMANWNFAYWQWSLYDATGKPPGDLATRVAYNQKQLHYFNNFIKAKMSIVICHHQGIPLYCSVGPCAVGRTFLLHAFYADEPTV